MEEIVSLISSLGFPVGIAVIAFYFYTKFVGEQMEAYAKREEKLTAQLDKFSESLNNFNVTLTKIDTRLEYLEKQTPKEEKIG